MQLLRSYINQAMALADLRNLAKENPIPVQYAMPNGESMIVVVSWNEPNNVTLPFNVCWIVADPESSDYSNMLRRSSFSESTDYRNTWSKINTLEDMVAESQYWDLSNGLSFGEVEIPQVGAATPDVRGIFRLNRVYTPNPSSPVVVADSDNRMKNARVPTSHTHPKLPITMARGATGVNSYYVTLDSENDPMQGHIFVLTGKGARDNQWLGRWRRPTAADLVYDGPLLTAIEIQGPPGDRINETVPYTFTATAVFDDGSRLPHIDASWAVIGNGNYANIGSVSGNFVSLDIDENQTVRVEARWTQPESGVMQSAFLDVEVIDTTIRLNLERITIHGIDEVEENSESSYTVVAHFDDGTSVGVTPDTFTSSNPGAGQFNAQLGLLTVPELASDQVTTLTATYTYRGVTKSDLLEVQCRDVTVYPASATIVGPTTIDENSSANYILRVTFSNGTQRDFAESDWTSSNEQAGTIDANGRFTSVGNLFEDLLTTINASYTLEGRTVYGTRQITVVDTTVYPRSASILGSSRIKEGSIITYQLQVVFDDDTTSIVNVSNWTLDNTAIGVLSPTTGQLIAAMVMGDEEGKITASYTANGVTVSASLNIAVTDETNYPISARIVGNPQMNENSTQTLQFEVTYLDNTKINQPVDNWASSNVQVATIGSSSGVLTAAVNLSKDATTVVTASLTAEGRTVDASLPITVRDVTNYPVSAVIRGPNSIDEGKQADYVLEVTFVNGSVANRTAVWSINGAGATINTSGRVTAPVNVDANTTATINAEFTLDGVTVNAPARSIQIIDTTVYPVTARIVGSAQITEGQSRTYQLEVTFSDSSVSVVNPTNWASSNPSVGIIGASSGSFSALEVNKTESTTISASYSQNGRTVGDDMVVSVLDGTNYPVSAKIVGVASLEEGTKVTYNLRVTYSDTTTATVAVTDWQSSHIEVGVIGPTTGEFTAAANLTADATTMITASYLEHGVTVSDSLLVTVLDVTVYPESATIEGPAVIDAEGTAQYTLRVLFEDGTSQVVEPSSWVSSNGNAATIDNDGLLTAKTNTTGANLVTLLTATFSLDGVSVSGERSVAVRDTTNYPQSIQVTGPGAVDTSNTAGVTQNQYEAEVTYIDGTKAVVQPTWSITGTPTNNVGTIDANGVYTTTFDTLPPNHTVSIRATYTEHGREVTNVRTVTLTVVPMPTSLQLNVPAEVNSEASLPLTHDLMFGTEAMRVPNNFFTDADPSVAELSPDGRLVTRRLQADTTITITSRITYNTVEYETSVQVLIRKAVELDKLVLSGPDSVLAGLSETYVLTAHFTDGNTQVITEDIGVQWSVSPAAAGAWGLDRNGRFFAGTVAEDTATTLSATYSSNGVTRTGTLAVTVVRPSVTGSDLPRYGVAMFSDTDFTGGKEPLNIDFGIPYVHWDGVQDFCDTVMTNLMPSYEGGTFGAFLGDAEYLYFMYPKYLVADNPNGEAKFYDTSTDFEGGMGGMAWTPEGSIPDDMWDPASFAPLEIQYDSHDGKGPQPWLIHRTDWSSLGQYGARVAY